MPDDKDYANYIVSSVDGRGEVWTEHFLCLADLLSWLDEYPVITDPPMNYVPGGATHHVAYIDLAGRPTPPELEGAESHPEWGPHTILIVRTDALMDDGYGGF